MPLSFKPSGTLTLLSLTDFSMHRLWRRLSKAPPLTTCVLLASYIGPVHYLVDSVIGSLPAFFPVICITLYWYCPLLELTCSFAFIAIWKLRLFYLSLYSIVRSNRSFSTLNKSIVRLARTWQGVEIWIFQMNFRCARCSATRGESKDVKKAGRRRYAQYQVYCVGREYSADKGRPRHHLSSTSSRSFI